MKVPLEWLKEFVTTRLSPEALAERLTLAGLEVVGIGSSSGAPVFDLEITPNRADCLSIIGVARETAAITGQRLKLPSAQGSRLKARGKPFRASSLQPPASLIIRIEDRKACSRYIGRLIDGVKVASSPEWMQRRLIACGARPINNLVDITNYVLLEYGQPLHAFDYVRLVEGTIIVRGARSEEPITTLDGINRKLSPGMLVIADAKQAVAVAGIMGGVGSEVTQTTSRVLLESARFDPITVRRSARTLGLASESSYRFERGVDPIGVETASLRAASLIKQLAAGIEVAVIDTGERSPSRRVISLEPARLERWLGTPVSPTVIRTSLTRLSCRVASSGSERLFQVSVPSFRQDLTQEVDLYEEIARVTGYDRLPATLPTVPLISGPTAAGGSYRHMQSLKCFCASMGLTEVITWSLLSEADLTRCGYTPSQTLRLANPLSQDHAYLRPSLLMGLLQVVRRNLTQGALGVKLFEAGAVAPGHQAPSRSDGQESVAVRRTDAAKTLGQMEPVHLGITLSGVWVRDWRTKEPGDFFRLKGLIETLLRRLCRGAIEFSVAAYPWAEPNQATAISLDGQLVGAAGAVARAATRALDIEREVWFAELSIEELLRFRRKTGAMTPPIAFPPIKRDLSVLVNSDTPFTEIALTIRQVGGTLAVRVELIDRYVGPQVPQGKSSLTFSIEYRDPSRTLTASEVDALHAKICQALVERFGATLR